MPASVSTSSTLLMDSDIPLTLGEYVASRYVEELERRLEAMERLLKSLAPGFQSQRGQDFASEDLPYQVNHGDRDGSEDFDNAVSEITSNFGELTMREGRYLGKSSGFQLARTITAFRFKDKPQTASTGEDPYHPHIIFFDDTPSSVDLLINEEHTVNVAMFSFPDQDLATTLIDLYFEHVNSIHPLLHRPEFERKYLAGAFDTDYSFRSLCFAIFALGSRFSVDPRVYKVSSTDHPREHSRGVDFFHASVKSSTPFCLPATLEDLQSLNLLMHYIMGSSSPITAWAILGFAVRRAQDVGAHRKWNPRWNRTPLEDQLRKRAWWGLYATDRFLSASLGRPLATHDEDIDLEYPLDLDDATLDEWNKAETSAPPPKNTGQPTAVSGFNCFVDLQRTTGKALRTVYAIKDQAVRHDPYPQWEQRIVAELDSDLNRWLEKVPQHLRWSPNQENKILVHRDFLSPERKELVNFPSLAICSNAARSSSHVLDNLRRRGMLNSTWMLTPFYAVTAGMILLINVYAKRGASYSTQLSNQAANDVQKCQEIFKALRLSTYSAFKMDITFGHFMTASDLPIANKKSDSLDETNSSSGASPAGSANQGGTSNESSSSQRKLSPRSSLTKSSLGKRQREDLPLSTEDLSQPTFGGDATFLTFGTSPSNLNLSPYLQSSMLPDELAQLLNNTDSSRRSDTSNRPQLPDLFSLFSGLGGMGSNNSIFTDPLPKQNTSLPPSAFELTNSSDSFGSIAGVGGLGGTSGIPTGVGNTNHNQGMYDWDAWSFLNALQNANVLDVNGDESNSANKSRSS